MERSGTAGTWTLYRDGVQIVNNWVVNTGTTPVGRMEIGDTAAGTFTVNFDDVVVDQTAGMRSQQRTSGVTGSGSEVAGSRVAVTGCCGAVVIAVLVAGARWRQPRHRPERPYAWGANPWGQLGDGTTTAHLDAACRDRD